MYIFELGVCRVLYSTVGCALSISQLKCESRQTHRLPYSTVSTHRCTDRHTHRLTYIQYIQTDRQTGVWHVQTHRQTDTQADIQYIQTDRQTGVWHVQTHRQTDTQVNMQADTGTETQADTPAGHAPVGEEASSA